MVQASGQDASWSHPFGGFLGASYWEEAPRPNEDVLEGLYVPSDLGTPQGPPGGAGERDVWVSLLD